MPVSRSRSRTKTIFCSLSGIASMAMFSPERAGPIWYHCSSSVPVPSGRRVNRQVADRVTGVRPRPTRSSAAGRTRPTVLTVSHSPMARVGIAAGEPVADGRAGDSVQPGHLLQFGAQPRHQEDVAHHVPHPFRRGLDVDLGRHDRGSRRTPVLSTPLRQVTATAAQPGASLRVPPEPWYNEPNDDGSGPRVDVAAPAPGLVCSGVSTAAMSLE